MNRSLAVWIGTLLVFVTSTAAVGVIIDDFDGGGAFISRVINPIANSSWASGDMFEVAKRTTHVAGTSASCAGSACSLPSAMSDDSVTAAAGYTISISDSQGIFGAARGMGDPGDPNFEDPNSGDGFFGVVDLDNPQNTSGTGTVTWTVNTAGMSNLSLSIDAGAMGDFEAPGSAFPDHFSFDVKFDSGSFTTVMDFTIDPNNLTSSHTYRSMDDGNMYTIDDPLFFLGADGVLGGGDDVVLDKSNPNTGVLDTFTATLPGTGTTMTLRFNAVNNGSDEAFAFDNIILNEGIVLPCDFDTSGACGLADINMMFAQGDLTAGVATTAGTEKFDLVDNNVIDDADIAEWLIQTGAANGFSSAARRGDTDNLDATFDPNNATRSVDITDFQNFLEGFTGAGFTWEVGNFNGNGFVDITDFSNHFLPSFTATGGGTYGSGQSVPEPSTILLLGLGSLGLFSLFRRAS